MQGPALPSPLKAPAGPGKQKTAVRAAGQRSGLEAHAPRPFRMPSLHLRCSLGLRSASEDNYLTLISAGAKMLPVNETDVALAFLDYDPGPRMRLI